MLGAAVVHRLPGLQRSPFALERAENGLFLLWLAWMGVLLLATFLLWRAGAWHRLVAADPTFLTVVITLLFFGCSLWAGRRAWVLGRQRTALDRARHSEGSWSGAVYCVPSATVGAASYCSRTMRCYGFLWKTTR